MASRSALSRLSFTATRSMQSARGATRYFSDDRGRVLSEEERAAENVYIKGSDKGMAGGATSISCCSENYSFDSCCPRKLKGARKPDGGICTGGCNVAVAIIF
ncbi:hypothetical protein SADUNF_Sadunf08G0010600 [Salix dunnii]|uniref:Uncharacterized protein n=1 Tax=Salix dunnii TaxID=1413687 RepID=A0A835MWZ5_9ROSI|nr:hypothetical protein SADUNF_Sadunf08G0010600 [Salix dunnii]